MIFIRRYMILDGGKMTQSTSKVEPYIDERLEGYYQMYKHANAMLDEVVHLVRSVKGNGSMGILHDFCDRMHLENEKEEENEQ